jgi:Predicted protein-tyrosine phosphatase
MSAEIYWIHDIKPLRLAVMPRPRGGEWLEDEIADWKRSGVAVVVSLLHRYELEELSLLEEETVCTTQGIEYRSFPIQDGATPESAPEFMVLTDELAALVKNNIAVAIHCRAGIGRSALTAGTVLLRLGVPAEQVFPMLSRARGLSVPNTLSQFVWFHSLARQLTV